MKLLIISSMKGRLDWSACTRDGIERNDQTMTALPFEPAAAELPQECTAQEVIRALEFDILFGRLKPRERLVEDVLMARFGAKRHIVRRSLDELERMGIVVRMPNRGAAVRDFTAQEVEEVYELRELLQRQAVERMPLPVSQDHIAALREIQERHDTAVRAADLRTVDQVNDAFHRQFFAACGNSHLADAIAHYAHLTRAMRVYPMLDPDMLAKLRDEHWAMIHALEREDREALKLLVVQHLQPSKAAYLKVRRELG
jgi:DNA-binding GntR family transcriptional regulator